MPDTHLAYITFVGGGIDNTLPSNPVDPGFGNIGRPSRPDNSLPPGAISLPIFPFDPTVPDNTLPGVPPPHGPIRPGLKFVVKWLACTGLILVPDNSLPTTPPPTGGQELPTTPEPK